MEIASISRATRVKSTKLKMEYCLLRECYMILQISLTQLTSKIRNFPGGDLDICWTHHNLLHRGET